MMRKIETGFLLDDSSGHPLAQPAVENETVEGRYKSWVLLVALIALLSGAFVFFAQDWILGTSEHILLSMYGSATLGDELAPMLAEAFLRDEFGAERTGVKVEGRDAKGRPYLHVWGKVPGTRALQVIVIHPTSSAGAFECLAKESGPDYCDIGMSSRPINDSDRRLYPNIRSLGDHNTEHVIALDGIAVIVNPGNLVSHLSIPQLRAIYTGQITNWKEVGGADATIELYGRDQNSGMFDVFTEKVMRRDASAAEESAFVPLDHQIRDSDLIVNAVMRSPNAIGYVSWPLIKSTKALLISDGRGPAIPPTRLSVVTDDYPICRRLLLYDWDEPGSVANSFIRYVTYKRGQAIVAKTPFIELTLRSFPVVPPTGAPVAYSHIASKYSRIGLSFHFSSAQAVADDDENGEPDDLADINVLRLRTFLSQHGGTGDDILLIGFADTVEESSSKEILAHKRAESVATNLRAVGVLVPTENIRDFGTQLAVASNDSPEGRSKNRRVEVWVRNGLL